LNLGFVPDVAFHEESPKQSKIPDTSLENKDGKHQLFGNCIS
jgi:hypothetical protein